MHFITNGYKRISKTNPTDPMQRVPLIFKVVKDNGNEVFSRQFAATFGSKTEREQIVRLVVCFLLLLVITSELNIPQPP